MPSDAPEGDFDELAFTPDEQYIEATAPQLESAIGRCHYCLKPLDDHYGWTKGVWPYMQFEPKLICEKWQPTTEDA